MIDSRRDENIRYWFKGKPGRMGSEGPTKLPHLTPLISPTREVQIEIS